MVSRHGPVLEAARFLIACSALVSVAGQAILATEPRQSTAEPVPFALAKVDKPLIVLEVMVDGKGPFRFVLDTGAGGTVVSKALAKELQIDSDKTKKSDKAIGAGGAVEVRLAKVESLSIGRTRREGLDVAIMDLDGIGKAIETKIDGIVGYNFLKHYRVTIDYPRQTVTFE
jgi:predicted aspartyl protease